MITRLEVDGFKSLRGFGIDLEPLTVLVGPNGAGKSNILEALALISRLGTWRTPEASLQEGRGRAMDQFWRHREEIARTMTLALETLEIDADEGVGEGPRCWAERMRYELELERHSTGKGGERVVLAKRGISLRGANDRWLDEHPGWRENVAWRERSDVLDEEQGFLPFLDVIQLQASHLRQPSERIDDGRLAGDASNLPSVLALVADSTLAEIRAEFVGLIPGIADFTIIERDDAYQLEFLMRDGDTVPARLASDGTLRMLALLTAVLGGQAWDAVVCIEEPENGIYPGRLRRLIDLLREASSAELWHQDEVRRASPQVIVTTHSPVFLTALKDHPRLLRYIDVVQQDRARVSRARPLATDAGFDPAKFVSPREIEVVLAGVWPRESDR